MGRGEKMLCYQCQDSLSDYIDGVMDLAEQAKMEHHVSECDECRSVRDDLLQIVQFSRNLPLHQPSNQIWTRIQSEIDTSRWRRMSYHAARWLPGGGGTTFQSSAQWAALAAILVVVSLTVVVALRYSSLGAGVSLDSNQPGAATAQAQKAGIVDASNGGIPSGSSIPEMEQTISQLKASLEQKSSSWDPGVRNLFNRDIVHVDQALERCRNELNANPADEMCKDLMMNAYREKVRLLEGFTDY